MAIAAVAVAAVTSPVASQQSPDSDGAVEVRITARRLADGRVEFGLQQRSAPTTRWGNRQLPGIRYFPTTATVGRWLNSSPLTPGLGEMTRTGPSACRPYGVAEYGTTGFPLPSFSVSAHGTIRVAVLFVDFPDARATHSTEREAELSLPRAEEYLEAAGYGQLDIEFVPLHRWLRADRNRNKSVGETRTETEQAVDGIPDTAVQLADAEFDFDGIDSVMVVMPSTEFGGGNAGNARNARWDVGTEEGRIPGVVRINIFPHGEAFDQPIPWGDVAAHELAHNFGLADLYDLEGSHVLPDAPSGKAWARAEFGLMGLNANFLSGPRDPRLAHIVSFPNGATRTEYTNALRSNEMLAWSRWQLGWLNATQIRCITEAEATVELAPVAAPGDGIAMAAIPLSRTEVIVIESRRKIGYDAGQYHRWTDGTHTTFPGLGAEGVLVYTVDASRTTGSLPLRLIGDTGNGQIDDYPILTVGQSATLRGYTITLESATANTHTVTITKAATNP